MARTFMQAGPHSLLLFATRSYLLWSPLNLGKSFLWGRVIPRFFDRKKIELNVTTKFGDRMRVRLPDSVQKHICFFGVWEPAITSYVCKTLRAGDTFIDIGANVGYYSLLTSRLVGPSGRVYAFEASPSIFSELQSNLERNSIGNVTARNIAVTDVACPVTIFLNDESNLGGSTIVPSHAERQGAQAECVVDGLPLTRLLDADQICSARLIKIDVEGAESMVVDGFRELIPQLSDTTEILMELSYETLKGNGSSPTDLFESFRQAGYKVFEIPNGYGVDFYTKSKSLRPALYNGEPFRLKDFLLRKDGPVAIEAPTVH